jgi:hypothetical protein
VVATAGMGQDDAVRMDATHLVGSSRSLAMTK